MKSNTVILSFLFIISIGCKQREISNRNLSNSQKIINVPNHLQIWAKKINSKNIDSIKNLYNTNSVKIISSENIIENSDQIANYYNLQNDKIKSIKSLFNIEANSKRKINYELINYKTNNKKEFIGIVIWKKENERIIREFEFTKENNQEFKKADTAGINEQRKLWIKLCNENNSKNLVEELYSINSIYYNHKPLIKGTEDLIKEYSYMNNKNYHLQLRPLVVKVVNPNFVFEIGQCEGSYDGKYIIVWEKSSDSKWKIIIDSNI